MLTLVYLSEMAASGCPSPASQLAVSDNAEHFAVALILRPNPTPHEGRAPAVACHRRDSGETGRQRTLIIGGRGDAGAPTQEGMA